MVRNSGSRITGWWVTVACRSDLCVMPTFQSRVLKPVRTPVAIFGSLGVCIYGPASRHWRNHTLPST